MPGGGDPDNLPGCCPAPTLRFARWASDHFVASVHKGNGGELICVDKGATTVGEAVALKQRNIVRDLVLVPAAPGAAEISVRGAVFEGWSYSGHVWVSLLGQVV